MAAQQRFFNGSRILDQARFERSNPVPTGAVI
jgi:hypothetical protein